MNRDDMYRYHRDKDDHFHRLQVKLDNMPWNPRTDMDGNIGTMFCMHRTYILGDDTDYKDLDGLKRAVFRELNIPMRKIHEYVKSGNANMDLKYNRHNRSWEIWGAYSFMGMIEKYNLILSDPDLEMLEDELMEGITIKDLQAIAGKELIILPLYLYDHSGLTMNTSGFICPWDSGQIGYIWTTIERVKAIRGGKRRTKSQWVQLARINLESEVKLYDQYLRGEVYGYIEEIFSEEYGWEETDSVWGYYTETVDPLMELADEAFGKGKHTDKLEMLKIV